MRAGEIGTELRRARQKAGLSQTELARRMGTAQSAIARAEGGSVRPSIDFLERFATVTGESLRLGSVVLLPVGPSEDRPDVRLERIRRAIGDYAFNPWLRDPAPAERRALEAEGLTRERFESPSAPSSSRD